MHWLEFWGLRVNGFESADALAEALFNTAPERRPALVVLGLMPKHLDTAVITDLLRRDRGTTALLVLINSVRSEEHTSELQSLMRISYAVFCLKKKKQNKNT